MIIPTDHPSSIAAHDICGWLAALNGPLVEDVDMSRAQREILLTLVCAYRAFVELPSGVNVEAFFTLSQLLIDATTDLGPNEPADKHLRQIADWLEHELPAVRPTSCRIL